MGIACAETPEKITAPASSVVMSRSAPVRLKTFHRIAASGNAEGRGLAEPMGRWGSVSHGMTGR